MHLIENQFEVHIEDFLRCKVAQFDGQIHPRKVEKSKWVLLLRQLGFSHDLVQKLRQDWDLSGEMGVDVLNEAGRELEVWLEEESDHGLVSKEDKDSVCLKLFFLVFLLHLDRVLGEPV